MRKDQILSVVAICISVVALLVLLIAVAADRSYGSELPPGRWVKVQVGGYTDPWCYFRWHDLYNFPDSVFVPSEIKEGTALTTSEQINLLEAHIRTLKQEINTMEIQTRGGMTC